MSLRFDLDVDTTRTLRDPLDLESRWFNRNLEKNGGFETLWVILHAKEGLQTRAQIAGDAQFTSVR